jgi:hypothetical protein
LYLLRGEGPVELLTDQLFIFTFVVTSGILFTDGFTLEVSESLEVLIRTVQDLLEYLVLSWKDIQGLGRISKLILIRRIRSSCDNGILRVQLSQLLPVLVIDFSVSIVIQICPLII